ncbi:hypothetical protein PoB_002215100 [Plakobranchus ocellatus]|uniref:Uncharacterized protein n=1 Tax=Plakobranchus ocellatus TaxID=259542 RepID=A0AAV3Z8L3_9GAST|nr:hypothetical protein PoB_002215100 [Plakobranchus ocellatus]
MGRSEETLSLFLCVKSEKKTEGFSVSSFTSLAGISGSSRSGCVNVGGFHPRMMVMLPCGSRIFHTAQADPIKQFEEALPSKEHEKLIPKTSRGRNIHIKIHSVYHVAQTYAYIKHDVT